MEKKNFTTRFQGFSDRRVCMNIVLDKRTRKKNVARYPVAMRFTYGKQILYKPVGGSHTEEEFSDICHCKKYGTEQYKEKKVWEDLRDEMRKTVREINPGGELSMELLKAALNVNSNRYDKQGRALSFQSLWKEMIIEKSKKSYGNGEAYKRSLDSFRLIVGKEAVKGFDIDISVLRKWEQGMINGVKRDGKLVGKVNDTTRGILLRPCRAVWQEAMRRGFLRNVEYPFSNRPDANKIIIPKGSTRKDKFINVEMMSELYQVFIEKRYPESWRKSYRDNAHYSLGLFLAQYLCNGFNLVDAGLLEYSSYYFTSGKKAFMFDRTKTEERCEEARNIIIPVIDELRVILDEIGAPEVEGRRVFPDILKGARKRTKLCRERLSGANTQIRKHLRKICKEVLGWDIDISCTWARHSFATNLRDAGVEKDYIAECMGHSTGRCVTSIYFAGYPLKTLFCNNAKLLTVRNTDNKGTSESIHEGLEAMSRDELIEYIKNMSYPD